MSVNWIEVGRTIRRARGRADLRSIAIEAGVSYHALWRLEIGAKPTAETLLKVCTVLGLDPFDITGLRRPTPTTPSSASSLPVLSITG